jgi:hypothetical protein
VREVAGLRHRATDGLLAEREQGVEIVDERLNLRCVASVDAGVAAGMDGAETGTQLRDAEQPAPYLEDAGNHEQKRDHAGGHLMKDPVVNRPLTSEERHVRVVRHHLGQTEERQQHQPHRPQGRPEEDARTERAHHEPSR